MPITITSVSTPDVFNTVGPTAALYGPPVGQLGTILNYPQDLGSSTKAHYVKFWIKTIKTTDIAASTEAAVAQFKSNSVGENLQNFGNFIQNFNINPPTTQSLAVIGLYMPDTVNAAYSADFDTLSLTNDLGLAIKGIQFAVDIASGISLSNPTGKMSQEAQRAAAYGGLMLADKIRGVSDNFAPAVASSLGYAINPQMQSIFRGVGFREFQLSFTFTPSSQDEAQTVNNIISTFRYHFAPDVLSAASSNRGLFFQPPSFFNVEFMFGTNENIYLPRYGDCVLTAMDVNFAPNGYAAHVDGAPVQTTLTLNFREIEIVTKSKLMSGSNPTGASGTYNDSSTSGLR